MPAETGIPGPVILNITNGDAAVHVMQQAGIRGTILPWQDVLHDGPVPDQSLDELSRTRASFIHACGWGEEEEILRLFQERDAVLNSWSDYDRILLWFEHDLYDQLQLAQLLDYFHGKEPALERLALINPNRYLGMLTVAEMASLEDTAIPVTGQQLSLAHMVWTAFRQPSPHPMQRLQGEELDALPWMRMAVERLFEEYPSCHDGLSRTERQLLATARDGVSRIDRIFEKSQCMEEARFMGDASFAQLIMQMLKGEHPLLRSSGDPVEAPFRPAQRLQITAEGCAVLDGTVNRFALQPLDRWIGGVHLTPEKPWCYDAGEQNFTRNPVA